MLRRRLIRLGRALDSVPFRLKVIGLVLGTTFILGAVSAVELRMDTYFALSGELEFRGVSIAQELAARAGDDVATRDLLSLHALLDSSIQHNQDMRYVFVVDPQGRVVTSTFPDGVPLGLQGYTPPVQARAEDLRVAALDFGGERIRDISVPLYAGDEVARVRVGMSESRIEAAMEQATQRLVAMTLLAGFVAALLGLLFTKLLLRPLEEMIRAMRRLAKGDFDYRLTPAVDADMAFLAVSFNEMAEDIEAKTTELVRNQERIESTNRELMLLQRLSPGFIDMTSPLRYLQECLRLSVKELSAVGGWACVKVGSSDSFCSSVGLSTETCKSACIETCMLSCRLHAGSEGDIPDDCPMRCFAEDGRLRASTFRDLRLSHAVIPARDGTEGVIAIVHRREDFNTEMIGVLRAIGGQIGVVIENLMLQKDSEIRERRLASLLSTTLEAQENERSRVARELHDDIGQKMTYLKLGLKVLDEGVDSGSEAHMLVTSLRETVSDGIDGVRRAIANLAPAPLDDLGLMPALERLLRDAAAGFDLTGDFETVGSMSRTLDPTVAVAAYRIVQEALTNAGRHSGASRLSVVVRQSDAELDIVIEDNGCGFDTREVAPERDMGLHLGLDGMRERCELVGGRLLIESSAGGGTTVHVRLPNAVAPRMFQEGAVSG